MRPLWFLLTAIYVCGGSAAHGSGLYTQMVIPLDSEREYSHRYLKAEHALVLAFSQTSPEELTVFDRYDERVVRRVLMKDLGPSGTEVKLVLRDRDVRAYVTHFDEPFRVVVDLFDSHFEEVRDPKTGMPLVTAGGAITSQGSYPAPIRPQSTGSGMGESDFVGSDTGYGGNRLLKDPYVSSGSSHDARTNKHRLLKPTPELFTEPAELTEAMRHTAAGIGKAWRTFPPYVYRIQTAKFEGTSAQKWAKDAKVKALSSVKAMADYGAKLFDFGHESKALIAYQQVLHRDKTIFDKDALHLWRFAEVLLGQGNLTLARGYYQALQEKHPESPLASFAKLRVLDIQAIRAIQEDRYNDTPKLLRSLQQVNPTANGELSAHVAIRESYWSPKGLARTYSRDHLPAIGSDPYNKLAAAYPELESRRTRFFAGSLVLGKMLDPKTPWSRSTGPFAAKFFKEFKEKAAEPYRGQLRQRLFDKLNRALRNHVAEGRLVRAIQDYEALPASLRSIHKNAATAWALAEAYRKLGQNNQAVDLYKNAAKAAPQGPDRFRAQFWLAVTSGEKASELKANGKPTAAAKAMETSISADRAMGSSWKELKEDEKNKIRTAYKDHFEQTVTRPAKLRTPAMIVLGGWTDALATRVSGDSGGDPTKTDQHFSPSGSAVFLLTNLAKRFSEMGMKKEQRQSLNLLRQMKPKQFADDVKAKDLWTKELVALAGDYRQASNYLEAGRLYQLVGEESENWEGRAEALYKGGLLLYRAGRREEAIKSFKESAADGNNLFYANLAKERLEQLE